MCGLLFLMRLFASALAIAVALPALAQVKFTKHEGKIDVELDGKPFTAFYFGSGTQKPFLHPIRAASGTVVSRVWPMEEKAGEAKDHIHHQGLWFTHGDVNGFDFWASHPTQRGSARGGDKKGDVKLTKLGAVKGGKKYGSITASFAWNDPAGNTLLTEDRTMRFSGDSKVRVIDMDIKLTGVVKSEFRDTKEGVFALRLAAQLDGKHSGKMTSAEGKVGEKQVWGKRSPWVDYAGTIDGEALGVAILDHPSNPKHPTYWHSRDYGLFAANIFGERDFYADKAKNGGMTLDPGQTWRFRYRVVVHPGDTASADVAGMFKAFSAKP